MSHYKKFAVVAAFAAVAVIGMSAMRPADDKPPKRNLKVLPKDISHDDLGKTMDSWKTALCHAQSSDSTSHHLDFASDAKPEKTIARHMYKMAMKINKKFFPMNKDDKGELMQTVTCITCHHGSPHPDEVK